MSELAHVGDVLAMQRALKNAPALVDVVTSQSVQSSDAQKGLGVVPDYRALFAWVEAELKAPPDVVCAALKSAMARSFKTEA